MSTIKKLFLQEGRLIFYRVHSPIQLYFSYMKSVRVMEKRISKHFTTTKLSM